MIEDIKTTITEKPITAAVICGVGIVVGIIVGVFTPVKKLFGKGKGGW